MMQLIQAYQRQQYRVVFASPADWSPHAVAMEEEGIEPVRIELNSSSFDDFARQLNPTVVMFDRFMMEEQFGWRVESACPQAVRILDMEDVHSLRHARHQAIKQRDAAKGQTKNSDSNSDSNSDTASIVIHELPQALVHSELAIREIAAILRCDLTLVISEYEMQWLQQQYQVPAAQLVYCPFMLDAAQVDRTPKTFEQRQHFVCIGNFRHEPNWDAVRWMREQLWPKIRQQLPNAELHIYGAYPPKKATQLHNEKLGFLVKGWAEDALEVVRNSRLMLAPLRFGAGLKGKLIDAAITGTPVVTTSVGAEGIYNPATEAAACVADSMDALVAGAVALYQQPQPWAQSQTAALQVILQRFERGVHEAELLASTEAVLADPQVHRMQGFYGMMLRHHSMKSTRYMSQWIEAKTRLAEVLERPPEES